MSSSNIRVLYIDDEENNLTSFKATFRRQYEIYTANSASEGLKIIQSIDIFKYSNRSNKPETFP